MKDLDNFFKPSSVAIVGVSRNPTKVGHIVFRNMLDSGFHGDVFAVNNKLHEVLNHRVYHKLTDIKQKVDLAVIAVPAEYVLHVLHDCKAKKVMNVLIITSGFGEIGNNQLEHKVKDFLKKNKIRAVGVNCLGIYDAHHKIDTLFLPRYRLKRPEAGGISFVCQSGAIGSAILDIATEKEHRFAKFVSYGNATDVDEADLIEYLGNDKETKVICLYVEGVKNGEKFFSVAKKVSKKKPIIVLKGGLSEQGSKAAMSHTGSLAGQKEVYFGVFKQAGVISVSSLEEMFNVASIFDREMEFAGGRIGVITNGGGYGIIATDNISFSKNLTMAELSAKTQLELRKTMPSNVNVRNPMDVVGDATTERYRIALEQFVKDSNIDGIMVIALYQTPLIGTDIVEVISEARRGSGKPIVVVSTGAEFTENLSESLEQNGVPTFVFPEDAVKAMDRVVWYCKKFRT